MDIKQKFNNKFKSLVKVPSNLTSGEFKNLSNLKPQINNLFHNNQDTRSGLADLNKNALSPENIKYIQEKHLPIVAQYTKQKELREIQINPYLTNPKLEQEIINSIEEFYYGDLIENNSEVDLKDDLEDDHNEGLKDDHNREVSNGDNNEISNELNIDVVDLNDTIESSISQSKNESNRLTKSNFDPFEHILNKLPDTMDLGFILEEKKKLNKQLMVVTKRVSDLIQQNQNTYNNELASVMKLQAILTEAINICSSGRTRLDAAKMNLTFPNLNIISTYRRREIMISLLNELFTIKTLLQTELTLNDLIMVDEDYAAAVKLCLECLKIIGTLNRYKCVTDLCAKLNYTIEMTEERLDLALARLCVNFNENQFNKICDTFYLLGKTQFLYDQLLIHFSTVINEKTFNIVNSYVELCVVNLNDSFMNGSSKNKERNFEDVCGQLSSDCFLPCLIDFNKSMWHIMVNYKKFIAAHNFDILSKPDLDKIGQDEDNCEELDCDSTLIKQKLRYGLTKIWQEIENKLTILIKNHNLSIYSFDDFISMINIVRKMIRIGCQFSNAKQSDQLEEVLKKATSEYFYVYHKSKMEEIKVFLETELWQLVPMKPGFSIEQLHEFNFLKNKQLYLKVNEMNEKEGNYFDTIDQETPFDQFMKCKRTNETEEGMKIEKIELPEIENELSSNKVEQHNVIVTNSSLNILRIVGKYMQIMIILNQISFDVLLCIFHLFDYYFYGIYLFFFQTANEIDPSQFNTLSPNLINLFKRIESTLILNKNVNSEVRMKFYSPQLSNVVNLNDKDCLFGLLERAIGIESLVFLADQLNKIYDQLSSLINEKDKIWLEQFFNQTVNVATELKGPIYMHVACKYIPHEQIVQSMEKVNWEVKELMSQHNLYVDQLIQDLQLFRLKETDLIQFCCKLSNESSQTLWTQMLKLVNFIFIEGFSTAKKCTPEGRALMQLDYQQFLCKIENIVTIKPIPNKELVDEYIKAYYYTEDLLENLIRSKRDYTIKQLRSLVNCTLNDNKKGRLRLLNLIDNIAISNR